jgi:uncharacterized protein with von Willebrand factor type A (vWA) domain
MDADVPETGVPLLLSPLLELTRSLRGANVPVSTSEVLDAMAALDVIDVADRADVKRALTATLVKRLEDVAVFDPLFELHFAARGSDRRSRPETGDAAAAGGPRNITTSLDRPADAADAPDESDPSTELLEALIDALRRGDLEALRELAGKAVEQFGGLGSQPGATERYFLYRVLRALELSGLMARALKAEREESGGEPEDLLVRRRLAERLEAFRAMLAAQVRSHMAELLGADEVARTMGPLSTDDTEFLGASPRQLAAMREAIRPLARSLATKLARRRRRRDRGRLDVRRTMRRSLSTGGVPIDPVFRRPKVARPDLYLVCDVSGSVSEFASFTLSLLQAMTSKFPRMRSFAFVDGVDEVSGHLKDVASFLEVRHVLYRAHVVRGDGHSDYGAVLDQFWDRYAGAIDSRSTVIITGDARSNGRPPQVEALRSLHARARRVYLFNPEPEAEWNTMDSIVDVYRPYLDGAFETRTLAQLADVVLRIS